MHYELIKPFFRNSLFDIMLNSDRVCSSESFLPKVNVAEKKDKYLINVDLPGMKKEDVKIDLKDNILTISGERKSEHKEEKDNYYHSEVHYGNFTRSFNLEGINQEQINAKYEDGVLVLDLKKSKKSLRKEIEIS